MPDTLCFCPLSIPLARALPLPSGELRSSFPAIAFGLRLSAVGLFSLGFTASYPQFSVPDGGRLLYPEVLFERMAQVVAVEVGVDFRGEDAFVSEHLLYLPDAGTSFEQVCGE